ncbi:cyclophilin-like fold protein [Sinorhizobium numidicum]|uniref:Cyclophilin-like fold protein n=1 Tax=Sinorhizobium numidicum TaxID=680248 RepID=A0ABY8D6L2_9HYPH|nr:cyclophilin-like fold protein [Sinorhizobium numidicum]WEX78117.1 cyclophilin-like fold protein [Sinorhizobium numidicum]WEX84776.1 cyclophilin-like fold protein [Sinorhizobium numidicum]
MSMTSQFMSRRAVLGGALAAAAIPLLAHGQEGRDPASQEPTDVRIRIAFNDLTLTATLYDNPSARDLASMLPLNLRIEDYGENEKIIHLPRKLTEEASGPFGNERPGDLCYFKPWGNLALFYADYRWDGLIRLGRFDNGFDPLLVRGEFPVRIERI